MILTIRRRYGQALPHEKFGIGRVLALSSFVLPLFIYGVGKSNAEEFESLRPLIEARRGSLGFNQSSARQALYYLLRTVQIITALLFVASPLSLRAGTVAGAIASITFALPQPEAVRIAQKLHKNELDSPWFHSNPEREFRLCRQTPAEFGARPVSSEHGMVVWCIIRRADGAVEPFFLPAGDEIDDFDEELVRLFDQLRDRSSRTSVNSPSTAPASDRLQTGRSSFS